MAPASSRSARGRPRATTGRRRSPPDRPAVKPSPCRWRTSVGRQRGGGAQGGERRTSHESRCASTAAASAARRARPRPRSEGDGQESRHPPSMDPSAHLLLWCRARRGARGGPVRRAVADRCAPRRVRVGDAGGGPATGRAGPSALARPPGRPLRPHHRAARYADRGVPSAARRSAPLARPAAPEPRPQPAPPAPRPDARHPDRPAAERAGHAPRCCGYAAPRACWRADGTDAVALVGATLDEGARVTTASRRGGRSAPHDRRHDHDRRGRRRRLRRAAPVPAAGARAHGDRSAPRAACRTPCRPGPRRASATEIRTPVMTTAVRGTTFRVGVDDGGTAAARRSDGRHRRRRAGRARPSTSPPASARWRVQGVPLGAATRAAPGRPASRRPRCSSDCPPVCAGARCPARRAIAPSCAPATGGGRRRSADRRARGDGARRSSWADLADGRYRVVIRAIDAEGLEGARRRGPARARRAARAANRAGTGARRRVVRRSRRVRLDAAGRRDRLRHRARGARRADGASPIGRAGTALADTRLEAPLAPGRYTGASDRARTRADGTRRPRAVERRAGPSR